MSYGNTQPHPGHMQSDSRNSKTQKGSRANQSASNAAKSSAFAGSDNYPSAPATPKAKSSRSDGTASIAPGYVPTGGPSPTPHKVGNTIRKVKG